MLQEVAAPPQTFSQRLRSQFSKAALIRTALVLCIFGFVPYAWMVGVPFLFTYGILKRNAIADSFMKFADDLEDLFNNFSTKAGTYLGNYFAEQPLPAVAATFARVLGTFLLLYAGINVWNMMAIYGLWRFSDTKWKESFVGHAKSLGQFQSSFFRAPVAIRQGERRVVASNPRTAFMRRLVVLGAIALYFAWDVYVSGIMSAFTLTALVVFQGFAVAVGMSAVWRDLGYLFKNPIKVLTENPGKFMGVWWGREFAYRAVSGRIDGNLGPAVGFVENRGAFSALFSSFLSPRGWFVLNDTPFGILVKKALTMFNSIFGGILFTSQAHLQGNIYGVIGPSPETIFFFALVGFVLGVLADRYADRFCKTVAQEPENIARFILDNGPSLRQRVSRNIYNARWNIAYLGVMTPLMLVSNSGPQLMAMAGGSALYATLLTASMVALSVWTVYRTVDLVKKIWNRRAAPSSAQRTTQRQPMTLSQSHDAFMAAQNQRILDIAAQAAAAPKPAHQAESGLEQASALENDRTLLFTGPARQPRRKNTFRRTEGAVQAEDIADLASQSTGLSNAI